MKNKEDLFKEIDRIEAREREGIHRLIDLKEKQDKNIHQIKKYEAHKWRLFQKIIKGEKYFRFKHIEDLGIKFDILIHLSAKNAGKTTELYREMRRIINKGEKFLYGRVYPGELNGAINQFEQDEESPVVLLKSNNKFYFYKKEDIETWRIAKMESDPMEDAAFGYPRVVDLKKLGISDVGEGYTFYNSNGLNGKGYDNYSTIFFDEILSYSPRNMINDNVLNAWGASISTVTRIKPSIRVYMMGNLQPGDSFPLLDYYGVSVDDDLRIIERGSKHKENCTILFVNSGGLYGGSYQNQAGITKHVDLEHEAFLINNKQIKSNTNILNSRIFGGMDYDTALAFYSVPDPYYIELRKLYDVETGKLIYCLKCSILRMTTLAKGKIYTDDPNVFNRFHNVERRITIQQPFNHINRLYNSRALKFDSMASLSNFSMVYMKYRNLVYKDGK